MYALKATIFAWLLLLAPSLAWSQVSKQLVGRYQMEMQGGESMELRADGTASLGGEETQWTVRGNNLVIGTDAMPYVFQSGRLILMMGPVQIAWRRVGGSATKSSISELAARNAQAETPSNVDTSQDAQYRQVLMNGAWCSFTYNKVSGTSTTRKVVFRPDGIMTTDGSVETYSSGYGGTYAGQSNNSNAVRWKYQGLRLYLDDGSGYGFQDVGLTATTNSNGSIILKVAGREYSMCR